MELTKECLLGELELLDNLIISLDYELRYSQKALLDFEYNSLHTELMQALDSKHEILKLLE